MKNKQIWIFFAIFIGLFSIFQFAASGNSGYYQNQAYNRPSYYGQQNYAYNNVYSGFPYMPVNSYRGSASANSVSGYGTIGGSPRPMTSTSCSISGCKTGVNSNMYVRNALDYAYYKNPSLLEPRYMDNHQRTVRGAWPQGFAY